MAINFTNFLNAQTTKPDYSGLGNLFENVFKGYQMQKEPEKMKQEALMREFENQMKKAKGGHAEEREMAELGLIGAQTNKANQARASALDPIQKLMLQQQFKDQSGQLKEDRKTKYDLESSAKDILDSARHVSAMQNDLGDDDWVTGRVTGNINRALASAGLGRQKQAQGLEDIESRSRLLQASLAKLASSRGGAQVMEMIKGAKPSASFGSQRNRNILKSLEDQERGMFNAVKSEYEEKLGKKFPYSIDDIFKKRSGGSSSSSENDPLGIR